MNKIYQKPFPGDKNAGFTLIELLVVVLIIGILSAIALPQYTKTVKKARLTEAMTLLDALGRAEILYHLNTGFYTNDFSALDIQMPGVGSGFAKESRTKYFKIEMSSDSNSAAESNSFGASAFFLNSDGSAENREVLGVMSNSEGQLNRICYDHGDGLCKSLTGGRQCQGSDVDIAGWCYKE